LPSPRWRDLWDSFSSMSYDQVMAMAKTAVAKGFEAAGFLLPQWLVALWVSESWLHLECL